MKNNLVNAMTPADLLSPAKKRQKEKYAKVFKTYSTLRSEGVASLVAKKLISDKFGISKTNIEFIIRTMKPTVEDGQSV